MLSSNSPILHLSITAKINKMPIIVLSFQSISNYLPSHLYELSITKKPSKPTQSPSLNSNSNQ